MHKTNIIFLMIFTLLLFSVNTFANDILYQNEYISISKSFNVEKGFEYIINNLATNTNTIYDYAELNSEKDIIIIKNKNRVGILTLQGFEVVKPIYESISNRSSLGKFHGYFLTNGGCEFFIILQQI